MTDTEFLTENLNIASAIARQRFAKANDNFTVCAGAPVLHEQLQQAGYA